MSCKLTFNDLNKMVMLADESIGRCLLASKEIVYFLILLNKVINSIMDWMLSKIRQIPASHSVLPSLHGFLESYFPLLPRDIKS